MGILEIILVAVGLAMDAFAVSVCKGLALDNDQGRRRRFNTAMKCAVYFGAFQAIMPLIGYLAGHYFSKYIASVDHWIAFGLLVFIGIGMLREARKSTETFEAGTDFKRMLPLAIATSIDALAVGITIAFLEASIVLAVTLIGVITALVSFAGVLIGAFFGSKLKKGATIAGGILLILIGLKILISHLIA